MQELELCELEQLVSVHQHYLDNFIKLGLAYENNEEYEKAAMVYKEGIKKAKEIQNTLSGALLGLLD